MFIVILIAFGLLAAAIARGKQRSGLGFFLLGALFPLIGLIVVALISPGAPVPPGMRRKTCPRCNAVQNVAQSATEYECWQCNLVTSVKPESGETWQEWLGKEPPRR